MRTPFRGLALVGLLALLGGCESERDRAFQAHFAGIALARRGDDAAAIGSFERAIALNPRLDAAHRELARIHLAHGHHLRALGSADAAIAIRDDAAGHHERRGDALVGLERWDDARAAYQRALALDAGRHVIHFKIGRVEESRADVEAAIAAYRRAAAAIPHAADARLALARLALARGRTGDLELAQTMLTEALAQIPAGEAGAEQRAYHVRLDARRRQRADAAAAAAARAATAREQALAQALDSGVLGVLGRMGTGPSSPWGRDTALGGDSTGSLGGLMGDRIGDSFGYGGLGLTGSGGGGGTGEGTIGLGNLGLIGRGGGGTGSGYGSIGIGGLSGRTARAPTVRVSTRVVSGQMPPEIAMRIVRRHVNEVRFCYERELGRSPGISGTATFTVVATPAGGVGSVAQSSSTIGSAPIVDCIARMLHRISFTSGAAESRIAVTFVLEAHAPAPAAAAGSAPAPAASPAAP